MKLITFVSFYLYLHCSTNVCGFVVFLKILHTESRTTIDMYEQLTFSGGTFLSQKRVCCFYNIFCLLFDIYKFTSKCHSQTTHPWSRDSQSQEKILAPSADKQTCNYDTEYSNHHPSLSTLRSKGLSCSKMKWWAIYTYIYLVLTTEGFLEEAIEIWPE